ncbi:MAG: Gfo/Idh/MocA family oxidoreductase [Bryobacteraceae bacterium]
MNRRYFLLGSASAAYAARGPRRVGPNDRVRLGFIGLGGRATWLIKNEDFNNGSEIVALADCYLPRCLQAAQLKPEGEKWKKYHDYRQMFDKEKLDAVFVETTTHARVLVAMHALQAGLDVYAEKPLTLTVSEGRALVNAVRKTNRILTTGTQQRSLPSNVYASRLVRQGAIGKVHTVVVCNFETGNVWQPKPEEPVPDGMNWDQWINQTAMRPFHTELQKRWAWYLDYDGGGQSWGVTGWGTHSLDQVQAGLGTDDTGPVEIWLEGTGPQAAVSMRYANGAVMKIEGKRRPDHADLGAIFIGDKGKIEILRGSYTIEPEGLSAEYKGYGPDPFPEGPGENQFHIQNFLSSVRTRIRPTADVEIGHRSTTLCHMVNIVRQLGRKLKWNPVTEQFEGDSEANALLARPRRKGFELPKIA